MLRRTLMASLMLAPMLFTACDNKDASGPEGTNAAVTVNAYVDANGNGALDAGDVGINNSSITLTGQDGTTYTATTNASGAATFDAVKPGSYTVSRTGTTPDGAVLATASSPVLVVPFQGGTLSSEFRYVFNPGSVSGQLFRDNNANGAFDTGDTPAPGMTVSIFTGTDTLAAPLATTTTDNNGVFTFKTLRPGNYTVKIAAIPTITIVGGTTQAVTVGANASTAFPVKFTGNLLQPISAVRTAPVPSVVAFEGVATVAQGALATSATANLIYVQDATAGIQVFGVPATAGIVAGDSVRVIGTDTVFNNEREVVRPTITKLGTVAVPAAKVLNYTQLTSGAFQGQLVTIPNVTVFNIGTPSASGGYNVSVRSGTAPGDTFQVRVNATATAIPTSTFVVGRSYDVTGELGQSNNVVQLKPRGLTDVVARSSAISIDAARQHPDNDTVTVEGVVYIGTQVLTASNATTTRNAYIMDKSAGALLFGVPVGVNLAKGDSIRVKGLVAHFPTGNPNGEYEIVNFSSTNPMVIEKLGTTTVTPLTITAAALASHDFDGSYVKIFGATVNTIQTANGTTGAFNVTATGSDGQAFTIRVANGNTGVTNANFTVGQRIDVSGAALNFLTVSTGAFTPEVLVGSPSDITASVVPANVKTIAQARAIAASTPDTVTVLGIVTAARGTFNTRIAYIYDGTGVELFDLPATLTLNVGDAVLVHGKATTFTSGATTDIEIANNSATDSIRVTKIGTNTAISPEDVTGAQFVSRVRESQLVRVQDVTVNTIGTQTTAGVSSYTVTGTTPDGTTITVFMAAPVGAVPAPATLFTVGKHYDITGIQVPFVSGSTFIPELKPRGAFDVVAR